MWALSLKRTDEPGVFDSKKNRTVLPVHHIRKGIQLRHREEQKKEKENNTEIFGMVGTNVVLKCDVGLTDVTLIWVKHVMNFNSTDVEVLAVNTSTLVDDKRYLVTHENNSQLWMLHIRYTKPSDQGKYECQVCNSPTFSIYVELHIFEAHALILGPRVREVDRGFPIRLSCIINSNSTKHYRLKEPTYMFWYHDRRMINYDLKDGAVVREGRLGTELIFKRALREHSGNYSCVPSNAKQASVQVIVHYPGEPLTMSQTIEDASTKPVLFWILLLLAAAASYYR